MQLEKIDKTGFLWKIHRLKIGESIYIRRQLPQWKNLVDELKSWLQSDGYKGKLYHTKNGVTLVVSANKYSVNVRRIKQSHIHPIPTLSPPYPHAVDCHILPTQCVNAVVLPPHGGPISDPPGGRDTAVEVYIYRGPLLSSSLVLFHVERSWQLVRFPPLDFLEKSHYLDWGGFEMIPFSYQKGVILWKKCCRKSMRGF